MTIKQGCRRRVHPQNKRGFFLAATSPHARCTARAPRQQAPARVCFPGGKRAAPPPPATVRGRKAGLDPMGGVREEFSHSHALFRW